MSVRKNTEKMEVYKIARNKGVDIRWFCNSKKKTQVIYNDIIEDKNSILHIVRNELPIIEMII